MDDEGLSSLLILGKVTAVHGLKGYVKVWSFAESNTVFAPGTSVVIRFSDKGSKCCEILKATTHKRGLLMLFKGIDRNAAESIVGAEICMPRSDLPALEPDTFYWEDLMGIRVEDINTGYLGVIDSIMPTGSNDVYVVKDGSNERLVPALPWVILSVDLSREVMRIDLPEGL